MEGQLPKKKSGVLGLGTCYILYIWYAHISTTCGNMSSYPEFWIPAAHPLENWDIYQKMRALGSPKCFFCGLFLDGKISGILLYSLNNWVVFFPANKQDFGYSNYVPQNPASHLLNGRHIVSTFPTRCSETRFLFFRNGHMVWSAYQWISSGDRR